jgi:hypothetical protein
MLLSIFFDITSKKKVPGMKYVFCLLLLIPFVSFAQDSDPNAATRVTPCNSGKYRQFDFWIGDWDVSSNGDPAGTNSIHSIHNGCALQENWQGSGEGGISGSSFNIYDKASDRWHQTWVDASGTLLELNGAFIEGQMVLSGERLSRDGSGMVLHRITWTPNEDGTVRQLWEVSKDGGGSWSILFDGLYAKSSDNDETG